MGWVVDFPQNLMA